MQSVIDFPWDWVHIDETTLVRTGQGVLHTVVINQADDKGTLSIWDGLEQIDQITVALHQPKTLFFDLEFHTNLVVAVNGTWDLTVNYK